MSQDVSHGVTWVPDRIISGGQTGVDRGALDAAIVLGIAHGGWCPRGRLAEDGRIPLRYELRETLSRAYAVRTECNVVEGDATLILYRGEIQGGTALTVQMARKHEKPLYLLDLNGLADPLLNTALKQEKTGTEPAALFQWLVQHRFATLNVAGPRESQQPGIAEQTTRLLCRLFGPKSERC